MSQVFIQIMGHLGQDPETRFTPSGQKVAQMRVATTIKRGGKEKTVWWRVTMWGDRFDHRLSYLKKGSAVVVWGEMGIPDVYQDKEGNSQTSFEIVAEYVGFSPFGNKTDRPSAGDEDAAAPHSTPAQHTAAPSRFGVKMGAAQPATDNSGLFADDDIPF